MSRTRRILSGTGIAYTHQAAVIILGLWLTPFLLRRVGQHELGLWFVVTQVLGYLALMDLGVVAILPREVAMASSYADSTAPGGLIGSLVAQVRPIVRWQVFGLFAACLLVWFFLPAGWYDLRWPLAIVFLTFVTLYPLRVPTAVLQGLQQLPFLSKVQFVGWALGASTTILLVLAGAGLYGLVGGWAVGMFVPAVVGAWRVRQGWPGVLAVGGTTPVPQYFRRSLWVSVSQVAQVLLNGSDVLLLARLLGPGAVVPYSCTGKLVTVFANHPQLLMHAAQPALSELRASESKARLAGVASALTQAMLIMSGGLLVVIVPVNQLFVRWWVGAAQYGGGPLTVAFAAMMLLRHWNVATVYTLFCFGYERQISLTSLADGVVSVVATVLLVWKWGPIGAPLGSILGVLLVALPLNTRSVAHEMGMTTFGFLGTIAPLLTRIALVSAAATGVALMSMDDSVVGVALRLTPVALLYAALVFPIAWAGPLRPYLRMALRLGGG